MSQSAPTAGAGRPDSDWNPESGAYKSRIQNPETIPDAPESRVGEDDGAFAQEEQVVPVELPPEEDPMAAHVTAGGIVSTYHNSEQRKQRLERKQAADFIAHCEKEVEAGRKDMREYEERLRKAQTRLREHSQEVHGLRLQLDHEADKEQVVPNRHGLRAARQQYDAAVYRMHKAEQVLQHEYNVLTWQQSHMEALEGQLIKCDELSQRVKEMEAVETRDMAQLAEYRAARELEVANRIHQSHMKSMEDMAEERGRKEEETTRALAVAAEGRRGVSLRMRDMNEALKKSLQELADYKQQQKSARQQVLLSLKGNAEDAYNKMVSSNERARKKAAKEEQAQAEERKVILQAGGNPYEVFRRRREEERSKKEIMKLNQSQTQSEKLIAAKMVEEDNHFAKQFKQVRPVRAAARRAPPRSAHCATAASVSSFRAALHCSVLR
jgi:hypothetical protein